jgi:hypothetical protein
MNAWIPTTNQLPPDGEVVIKEIEECGRVFNVIIEVKGITFKRTQDKWKNLPPVWTDVHSHFGQRDLCSKEKEAELEAIYQALNPELTHWRKKEVNNA